MQDWKKRTRSTNQNNKATQIKPDCIINQGYNWSRAAKKKSSLTKIKLINKDLQFVLSMYCNLSSLTLTSIYFVAKSSILFSRRWLDEDDRKQNNLSTQYNGQIDLNNKFEINSHGLVDFLIFMLPLHVLASHSDPQAFLLPLFYSSLSD